MWSAAPRCEATYTVATSFASAEAARRINIAADEFFAAVLIAPMKLGLRPKAVRCQERAREALFHGPPSMRVKVLSVRVVAGPVRLREGRGQAHGQTSDRSGDP